MPDSNPERAILDRIARGRTDLVFELLALSDWKTTLNEGRMQQSRS